MADNAMNLNNGSQPGKPLAILMLLLATVLSAKDRCPVEWETDAMHNIDGHEVQRMRAKGNPDNILLLPYNTYKTYVLLAGVYGMPHTFPEEGLIPVSVNDRYDNRWGYINRAGKFVIAPRFTDAQIFTEGLAAVQIGRRWGYIDTTGKFIVKPRFDGVEPFSEGRASVRVGTKWGYINHSGTMIFPPRSDGVVAPDPDLSDHDYGAPFREGRAAISIEQGTKWGYIDTSGRYTTTPQFSFACDFAEGLAFVVSANGEKGFLDRSGRMAIKGSFDNARNFSEGLAAVERSGKWGFIDTTGHLAIPYQFDTPSAGPSMQCGRPVWGPAPGDFSQGLAPVLMDNRWGFIDRTGKVVIKPRFDQAYGFAGGYAAIRIDGKNGYVDRNGKPTLSRDGDIRPPSEGVAAYSQCNDGESNSTCSWGFVDHSGKVIIKAQFAEVTDFEGGLSAVTVDNRKWGFIRKPDCSE